MAKVEIAGGTAHKMPADLKKMILSSPKTLALWQDITPLARNEWICWVTSGKLAETRVKRIQVGKSKMLASERRPCCWVGCLHRTDKAPSPTQKWVLNRTKK